MLMCGACGRQTADQTRHSQPTKTMLAEASMNFDSDQVRPFLERVKPMIESGFGDGEIAQVLQMMEGLKVDEEKEMELSIRYRGKQTVMRIDIFMDDINAPDMAFHTDPELAKEIDTAMKDFADELGI